MQPESHNVFEDEGAGYLISVSDIMAGLLFIFIITLMAFVINFKETNEQLTNAENVRKELLQKIKDELVAAGIEVKIDEKHGILRLTERAIRFKSGEAILYEEQLKNLKIIGRVLADILPCYTFKAPDNCDSRLKGRLDSVFIEGHTDNQPTSRRTKYQDNWDLSADRAIRTYKALTDKEHILKEIVNGKEQPIISVSGYGDGRPLIAHETITPDPANRRIDLRFIMTPPQAVEPIRKLEEAGIK